MIREDIISDLRSFDWRKIIALDLEDLNDSQWRFMKGLVVELAVEKYSGTDGLVYIGDIHRDFHWPKHNMSVELKSLTSTSMYGVRGDIRKHFNIKLSNSNGTNRRDSLGIEEIADLLIVVTNNGSFVVDSSKVLERAVSSGDGFDVRLHRHDIVELTGRMYVGRESLNLREDMINLIRERI
jgi:hypothetical protein